MNIVKRITSCFVLITFLSQQTLPAGEPLVTQEGPYLQPVKSVEDAGEDIQTTAIPQPHAIPDSTDFLQDSPLSSPTTDALQTEEEVFDSHETSQPNPDYEYERYDFDEALDLLRPEFASAVIVKGVTQEDLKSLLDLSIEVGILVLHGEIVLITSGSEDEIGVLPAVKELVRKASLISHTHPGEFSKEGPSAGDIHEAVEPPGEEYVITHKGIYAYNNEGVLFDGKVQSYDWYIEKINQAVTDSKAKDQTLARAELNQFISEQDRYNQATEEEKEILRMGGTWSPTSVPTDYLLSVPETAFGSVVSGSSAGTSIAYDASQNQYLLNYDVTQAGSYSTFRISFDDPATQGVVETKDLSKMQYFIFGLRGLASSVTLIVTNINGVSDLSTLTNMSNTTEQFWRINTSAIFFSDKTKIKSYEFRVMQANTTSATRTGTLALHLHEFDMTPPTQPVITSTVPAATRYSSLTLTGTKQADTNLLIARSDYALAYSSLVYPTSTTWSVKLYLNSEGNNSFTIRASNPVGAQSATINLNVIKDNTPPTGQVDINSGAPYTNSNQVTLNLSGNDVHSGVSQMSFSQDNVNWTAPEGYASSKTYTLSSGNGVKTVYVKYFDLAGNVSSAYSKSIVLDPNAVILPTVIFTSPATAAGSDYTLTYTVDGVPVSETWKLSPGSNQLLVRASVDGKPPAFASYDVMLNQSDPAVPPMPEIPTLTENLISVTTQDGLVLKYDGGNIVSVEKPGEYALYLPEFDSSGNLTAGVLEFSSGDRLLYQDSKPIYQISQTGEKTYYSTDGTVSAFETQTGEKTRFSYRLDAQGNVISILALENSAASLYGTNGRPVWITKSDGTDIRYENGILKEYMDSSGNLYVYEITDEAEGQKSELKWVTPSGAAAPVSLAQILANLSSYPAIEATLEQKIAKVIHYDASGKMTEFDSGNNEILRLQNGLPASLKDASGNITLIQSTLDSVGNLDSIYFDGALPQSFDSSGNLASIMLSDGTILEVSNLKADEITLSDGTVLTQLGWNGNSLTGFVRTKPDGTKEIYESSKLVRVEEANGSITTYVRFGGTDHPDTMTTSDGRTYKFIEYQNELGLKERVAELISMDLEDGSRLEFEKGKPVRYIQTKQVMLDPWEVPLLPEGQAFIPSVTLGNAELRAVTIDAEANILSGEILFLDGTQYLIKDGLIFKQITPDGQILEIKTSELPPIVPPAPILAEPLTSAEIAYRNQLVEHQLNFFVNGIGIDPYSGMPLDNYKGDTNTPSDYSQATLVGFWAELLATIARGDYSTSKITQAQAFEKLVSLLTEFKKVQQQAGWNGMVAFFKIETVEESSGCDGSEKVTHYTRQFDSVGIGDNLNLSLSITTVIGALSNITLNSTLDSYRNQIISLANQILTAQDAGYAKFYDPFKKRFHMAYQFNPNGTGQFTGHMDRVFNEFRSGLIWLVARKPEYRQAVDNLDVAVRPYATSDGRQINNAVPFDGNAFQMFWPLIHVDETKYAEFDVALKNFLYSQADFVRQNRVPGLLSAGDTVGSGYSGKMGMRQAAETDDPLIANVGSIYGTASAFALAPHYTLQFLKNLETLFPGIKTNKGYVDALKLGPPTTLKTKSCQGEKTKTIPTGIYSADFYGVDQAGFILSLLNKSQGYFSDYLAMNNLAAGFDSIYGSMSFNLTPIAAPNPAPPDFGSSVPKLYTSTSQAPDGRSNALIRQDAFITSITDPDYGIGKVYSYLNPDGKFHHMEVEFSEAVVADGGEGLMKMNLGEYLLLPGRREIGRSLLERFSLDVLNQSYSQGAFYTQDNGFASQAITVDPYLGEVRRVGFDLLEVTKPVGLWALFHYLDLSAYDFLSIPVRLAENAPEGVGIKIELKGLGEVFLTGPLTHEWQFFQIPVVKPAGLLTEIAVSIQSPDGNPVEGELYLGPLSAFKVRTSAQIDWLSMVGSTETEIKNILKTKVVTQSGGGGPVEAEEVLENFSLDSEGKLVSGILRKADGSIQYYSRGKLDKWVFKNGKTAVFEEDGLGSFIIDLSRGQLEESRFYYDQSLKGEIRSFILQDNLRKRVFGLNGNLQTMISDGQTVNFKDGAIDSIVTPNAVLTQFQFADDGSLLKAHVRMNDGREFDIDQTGEQVFDTGDGVNVYYFGSRVTAVETPENRITRFNYRLDAASQIIGVDAIFTETVIDPVSGEPVPISRTIPLSEYIRRPERTRETQEILRESPLRLLPGPEVGGFSTGFLPSGEITYALSRDKILSGSSFDLDVQMRQGLQTDDQMGYLFNYESPSGPVIGGYIKHMFDPVMISNYGFMTITLRQHNMDWAQDFNVKLKTTGLGTAATFLMSDVPNQYKTYEFSLAGRSAAEGEITIEAIREPGGIGKIGMIYIQDISYFALRALDRAIWEDETGLTQAGARNIRLESGILTQVGREIAQGKPLTYGGLVSLLDIPTRLVYTDKSVTRLNELVTFKRFDGSEVSLDGQNVTKIILPDGTINEYQSSGNTAGVTIKNPASGENETTYTYGALRKVTQSDGRVYEFSYEFDSDGKEITVMKDSVTGDERRYKDGKLISSTSGGSGLNTSFQYENGVLIGAELFYKNKVIQSTEYRFKGDETRVTDDNGTTWFYDANGNLLKHYTKDGFLYEYSDFTFEAGQGAFSPDDFKSALFSQQNLRAVILSGREFQDGTEYRYDPETGLAEIKFPSGDTAVNLAFDNEQKIKSGQIQFANGLVIEIENYVPVGGITTDGTVFTLAPFSGNEGPLVQEEDGSLTGIQIKKGDRVYTYNLSGELVKMEDSSGVSDFFTYERDPLGVVSHYARETREQLKFKGVLPFPKEVDLAADDSSQKIFDSGVEVGSHEGAGFVVGAFNEALNVWDVFTGSFSSAASRFGLEQFLREIKPGQFVAASISDPSFSYSEETENILALFEGLGAGGILSAAQSHSKWTFFGNEALKKGEGSEAEGEAAFSTVAKTSFELDVGSWFHPIFDGMPAFLNPPSGVFNAYSAFLKNYQTHTMPGDLQFTTVFNDKNEIVYSERIDHIRSYYEHGKIRESYNEGGEFLSTHEYFCPKTSCTSEELILSKVTLVKARQDFEAEQNKMRAEIAQAKYDALMRLEWQDEQAKLQIEETVTDAVAQYDSAISGLESQRFQDVKMCHSCYIFAKCCDHKTVEVPAVRDELNRLQSERSNLISLANEQITRLPEEIELKRQEIETATQERMLELENQEREIKNDMLHQEMDPVLYDVYRRVLGRDPSTSELNAEAARYEASERIDVAALFNELNASSEKTARGNQKAAIILEVKTFLQNYLSASETERTSMLQGLALILSEVIDLDQADVEKLIQYFESRDLHFGQSAFDALRVMLESQGISVSMETLAKEAILIDVLTGTIHPFTEGELVLSVFSLNRTAQIHGRSFTGVQYGYDDLLTLYRTNCSDPEASCGFRVIAHIGEDHFVVITNVTDTTVSYIETSKGENGENLSVTKNQFLGAWITESGEGYLIVPQAQAIEAKRLTDEKAKSIRGAFWPFFFFIAALFLSVASFVVSFFSPTFGKILGYAALAAGIVGIVASLTGWVVQGLKTVFSRIAEQGLFQTIKQGFIGLGKILIEPVKFVGRFIQKGFTFLKDGFSGGFRALGSGIMKLKDFILKPLISASGTQAAKFTAQQVIARQLIGAALSYPISKGLEGLGLNPALSALAGGFIGAGFLGVGSGLTGFIKSGLQNLVLQGVSIMGLKLDLPPPITSALSIITSTALTSYFDGSLSLKTFTNIAPKVSAALTIGGLDLIGRSLGINPTLLNWVGLPIQAVVTGIVSGGNTPGSIWNTIQGALISGTIEFGAKIGLDAINAPPILQSFVPGLLSQLLASVSGGTSGEEPGPDGVTNEGRSLFDKIAGIFSKFGGGLISGVGNVVSFGAKVLESGVNFIKEGFAKAGEFFAGIFDRKTIEDLTDNGTRSLESSLNDHCSVLADGIHCAYKEIDIDYLLNDDRLSYKNTGIDATFTNLKQAGGFFGGDIALAQEAGPDGIRLVQDYDEGKLTSIKMFDELDALLEISPIDEYIPLSFSNDGKLLNAKVTNHLLGASLDFFDGNIADFKMSVLGESFGGTTFQGLSDGAKENIAKILLSAPGISNETGDQTPSYLIDHKALLEDRLTEAGLSENIVSNLSFFKQTRWADARALIWNDITGGLNREMRIELDKFYSDNNIQIGSPIYPLFYSGSVEPGLKALEMGGDNAPVVFAVGGYNSHNDGGPVGNGSTRLFVNILGNQDGVASPKTFSNVETLNIIFEDNVGHTDYFNSEFPYHDFIVEARVKAAISIDELKNYVYNSPYVTRREGNKVYLSLQRDENT